MKYWIAYAWAAYMDISFDRQVADKLIMALPGVYVCNIHFMPCVSTLV